MTDKNAWNIDRLIEWRTEVTKRFESLDKWQREHDKFKDETIQQLLVIFDKLKELQEGDKWIKRMFLTALIGTASTAIGSFIMRFM